ncbi:MAG TPA: caspase family protein [Kofleriaceae bacterium]|jgi:hypothetical protein|nr:caspase family protein [Kofleriaceae bacterium]
MAKRALIIRPDYDPLAGFRNSADCIDQVLRSRGFEIELCADREATRAGILQAYDRLIQGTRSDDAVAVIYIGHGGLTTNQNYSPNADLPRCIQNICPTDFGKTTDDDFRGISSFELSLQLAALTRKTRNATLILECCFSAQLARGDEPADMPRTRPKLSRVVLTRHLQELRERSRDFSELELTGNPDAVRVAAAGQTESAYQLKLPSAREQEAIGIHLPEGAWISAMTLRLAEILTEVGTARVSWRSIATALRARLTVQRPEIEGPVTRMPFSLATVDAPTFAVRIEQGRAIVEAGRLLGVSVGDVYGVMPAGSTNFDPKQAVAQLTIDEVTATRSFARQIAWHNGASALPAHAVAIATSLSFERLPVHIAADAPARQVVEAALESSRRVRAATPHDRNVLAELRVQHTELALHDAQGPLFPPARYPDGLGDAVRDLENLATEHRLRVLSEDEGIAPIDISVELFVVGATGSRKLADHGEALGLGDRIALQLENKTSKPVFANVFNIGLRRRIELVSAVDPSGVKLLPHKPRYVGDSIAGQLTGYKIRWPSGLPRDQPRLDTLMVMLTAEPADLRALESTEHLARTAAPATALEALLGQRMTGRTRGPGEASRVAAFAIYWRDYRLFPLDGSLDFGAPEVDASPIGSEPPRAVAAMVQIRLHALEAPAGTRVDVLVCARSPELPYRATTLAGDVPRDLVVWRGELAGPADIYLWTSTDPGAPGDPGAPRSLADLLAQRPIADPVAILCSPAGDPRSPLAAGASMQLAAMARAALFGIAPDVTTAFHGSFGADDPGTDRNSAASVSFEIAIERLGS